MAPAPTTRPEEQQRLLAILDYWHKIEFFIPFDLDQVGDAHDGTLRWLGRAELAALPASFLPDMAAPAGRQISGFRLYLGVFDKADSMRACQLPAAGASFGDTEKSVLEGRSCFARIPLDARGAARFDPLAVSSLPWAIGRSQAHGIASLDLEAFATARLALQDALAAFGAASQDAPLSGAAIIVLHQLFTAWAGFDPGPGQPLALLETVTVKQPDQTQQLRPARQPDSQPDSQNQRQPDLLAQAAPAPGLDILNSFYIEDLERAIRALRAGAAPAALAAYLTPLAPRERIDVYSDAGRKTIIDLLHPACANRGRWLDNADRNMSLMQQFALNAGLGQVADGGLFSVNGPPGTGKTTLLRDIFADNIVRRGAVLARLDAAADAFEGKLRVSFDNGSRQATIARLKPALCGYEMVLASSNNGAVENLSADLPRRSQIGAEWAGASYLQSVALRLAAEGENGKLKPLSEADTPWGLISCALGKRANRQRFVATFYYDARDRLAPSPAGPMHSIRQWLAAYQGPDFGTAAAAFRAAEQALDAALAELGAYADLWQEAGLATRAQFCQAEQVAVDRARRLDQLAQAALRQSRAGLDALLDARRTLAQEQLRLEQSAPGFFARLLRSAGARRHKQALAANAGATRAAALRIAESKTSIRGEAELRAARAASALDGAAATLAARQRLWDEQQARLAGWRARYPDLALPASADELEQDSVQIAGLWQDAALARLRSALFASALTLHEAWLAEVAQKGGAGFAGNLLAIAMLLENKQPDLDAAAATIWHSLFMVVPLVSTTFASFARQFRGMGGDSLGWLFIDEAGQAAPQAAVGALWRARRAIVVGDPLQIEPVCGVPAQLADALAALSPHTSAGAYAPQRVSVQRLADDANRYGAWTAAGPGQERLWTGSPLRVHRRCAEPMFGLSNAIAYSGKMVFGLACRTPAPGLRLGPSAWIDIAAPATTRQVVPQQIELVAALLRRLYARDGALPPCYIISPFKAVRQALRQRLLGADWGAGAPGRAALEHWCREMVGTVHTFQGKEQSAVIMVLGGGAGAAAWAASAPNLLNVALTRARQHFYIVGAAQDWGRLPYFSAVHAVLPRIAPQDFLDGVTPAVAVQ